MMLCASWSFAVDFRNESKSETLLGEQQRGTVYFLEKDTHDSVCETVVSLTGKVLVEAGGQ